MIRQTVVVRIAIINLAVNILIYHISYSLFSLQLPKCELQPDNVNGLKPVVRD